MTDRASQSRADSNNAPLLLLLILFACSGCSALIYEVVWYQLLQFVIGSTAVSLAVLLSTFMGGLCLGSLFFSRVIAVRGHHPLRLYAAIEAGIGLCGLFVMLVTPIAGTIYATAAGHGAPAILLRAILCAICLLPPTVLMGASLPAIARWVYSTPRGASWLGLLYGGNTLGAVFGCLLAGFYLLRIFDMRVATYVAAAINFAVALVSFLLAKRAPEHLHSNAVETTANSHATDARPASNASTDAVTPLWPVYLTTAISGACALGAEVLWTRALSLILGATVYTFSIILAVFLLGLGIGATGGAWLSLNARAEKALGYCQLLLTTAIFWTAFTLVDSIPYWPIDPRRATSPWFTFQIDLVRVLWTILPAALLWGASFPLALVASVAASRDDDRARPVGAHLRHK
jgi:spermidine synthase